MKINFEEIFKIHGEIVNDTPVQRLSNEQSMFIYLNCNAPESRTVLGSST